VNAPPDTVLSAAGLAGADAEQRRTARVEIASQSDFDEVLRWLAEVSRLQIRFHHFTDGRGFSWAQQLRRRYGYRGRLEAVGSLLPDQQQMLEQCGFDLSADDSNHGSDVPRFTVGYEH